MTPQSSDIIASLSQELNELKRQLWEAEEALKAIRTGQVDALVVETGAQQKVYTLTTADQSYRTFLEQMNEGAVTLNEKGLIVFANSQFAQLLNQPLNKIIGDNFRTFVQSGELESFEQLFEKAWHSGQKGEINLICSGCSVSTQISFNILELTDGLYMSIIITDLTTQKLTEKKLADNNSQLEQLNKNLEASNYDLQQFASVASHDLQEPLRKIQVYANLLIDEENDKTQQAHNVEKINNAAGRMRNLIADILSYSRLLGNKERFVLIDLNELISELLEDFELKIIDTKAVIYRSPMPSIYADRSQIRQMLQNLLSNALKFSRSGVQPVLTVSAELVNDYSFESPPSASGRFSILTVRDNGIGFDENYIDTIFGLFERLNSKDVYEGSGIGLAIIKRIVEKHHGLIQARSLVGSGSVFSILLPVSQVQST